MGGGREKNLYQLALFAESRGEAPMASNEGTEPPVAGRGTQSRAEDEQLMEEVVSPENAQAALKRVMSNRGAPGVDGMTVDELPDWLRSNWPTLGKSLLDGSYRLQPVLRVEIPKPSGGMRKLGIPTVVDRFVQQIPQQMLQRRALSFVRYADDCNIYVRSQRTGERVMTSVTRWLEKKLKLRVNREKSAVGRPWRRKFLGFGFTNRRQPERRIAPKSVVRFKRMVRSLTPRSTGQSLQSVVVRLARYLRGWLGYFGFCQTPSVLMELEEWIRRRLRCLVWKQ